MKSDVCAHGAQQLEWRHGVTSRQVKASHWWWVCNKLHHPAIIPEQGASKIVKISQQMVKLCRKLKWLVFFWDTVYIQSTLIVVFTVLPFYWNNFILFDCVQRHCDCLDRYRKVPRWWRVCRSWWKCQMLPRQWGTCPVKWWRSPH